MGQGIKLVDGRIFIIIIHLQCLRRIEQVKQNQVKSIYYAKIEESVHFKKERSLAYFLDFSFARS